MLVLKLECIDYHDYDTQYVHTYIHKCTYSKLADLSVCSHGYETSKLTVTGVKSQMLVNNIGLVTTLYINNYRKFFRK